MRWERGGHATWSVVFLQDKWDGRHLRALQSNLMLRGNKPDKHLTQFVQSNFSIQI